MSNVSPQLKEIASWRIVSELARRYPDKFTIIETHPGGGQYDCLSLYIKNKIHIADFNRKGSLHIFNTVNGKQVNYSRSIWDVIIASEDLKQILDDICSRIKLKIPAKLPSSTKSILVYRFIAELLTHAAFGIKEWSCKNGMHDSSGSEGLMIKDDFKKFPGAKNRLAVRLPDDVLREAGYRFWFIRINDAPVLCLETTGTVWDLKGNTYDLMELYKKDRKIWSVIHTVAGNLLS